MTVLLFSFSLQLCLMNTVFTNLIKTSELQETTAAVQKEATVKGNGFFTLFLGKLFKYIFLMPDKYAKQILEQVKPAVDDLFNGNKKLLQQYLPQPLLTAIRELPNSVVQNSVIQCKHIFGRFANKIRMRHTALSKPLNDIFNFMDELYETDMKHKMLDDLNDFKRFPNVIRNSYQLVKNTIVDSILTPFFEMNSQNKRLVAEYLNKNVLQVYSHRENTSMHSRRQAVQMYTTKLKSTTFASKIDDKDVANNVIFINDTIKIIAFNKNKERSLQTVVVNNKIFTNFIKNFFGIVKDFGDTDIFKIIIAADNEIKNFKKTINDDKHTIEYIDVKWNLIRKKTVINIRKSINNALQALIHKEYSKEVQDLLNFIDYTYKGEIAKSISFLLDNLNLYKNEQYRGALNLNKIVKTGLREVIFEHYESLDTIEKVHLLKKLKTVWPIADVSTSLKHSVLITNTFIKNLELINDAIKDKSNKTKMEQGTTKMDYSLDKENKATTLNLENHRVDHKHKSLHKNSLEKYNIYKVDYENSEKYSKINRHKRRYNFPPSSKESSKESTEVHMGLKKYKTVPYEKNGNSIEEESGQSTGVLRSRDNNEFKSDAESALDSSEHMDNIVLEIPKKAIRLKQADVSHDSMELDLMRHKRKGKGHSKSRKSKKMKYFINDNLID